MPTILKNKIIYDEKDWLAGLHPQDGSKTIPQKFGQFSSKQYSFNPFANLGYAQNGFLNRDLYNSELIKARLVAKANTDSLNFLAIDNFNKIHFIRGHIEVESSALFPHIITGTTLGDSKMCYDIIKYGSCYYYAWKGSSNNQYADIGRFDGSSTFDDDYMSTVPTGANTVYLGDDGGLATKQTRGCSLCVGYDDVLYSGGRNYLSAYDETTGTFIRERLKIPSNYNIVKILKLQPASLVIFAQSNTDSKAFFWDYLSEDPYQIKDLYDYEILSAFEYRGTVGCVTQGSGNTKKIKIYNGAEFEIIAQINKENLFGPINHGVATNDNEIYLFCLDDKKGLIYKYGNNYGFKNNVNVVAISDKSKYNVLPGIISIGDNNAMLTSNGPTQEDSMSLAYTQQYFYDFGMSQPYKPQYSETGLWSSDLIDIGDERIQITNITIYFANKFSGDRTISLALKDRSGTYNIAGLVDLERVTSTNRIYRAKPILNTAGTPIPPLDGVGIELNWGSSGIGSSVTPIINKVVLDYKPVTIN